MRTVLELLVFAMLLPSAVPALADCERKGVVVVDIQRAEPGREPKVKINGAAVKPGAELEQVRKACARNMVVLMGGNATFDDLERSGFYSSKNGFHRLSNNYFLFSYSSDRRQMRYLATGAAMRFSDDPADLEEWVTHAPVQTSL